MERIVGVVGFLTLWWIAWSIVTIVVLHEYITLETRKVPCEVPHAAVFPFVTCPNLTLNGEGVK